LKSTKRSKRPNESLFRRDTKAFETSAEFFADLGHDSEDWEHPIDRILEWAIGLLKANKIEAKNVSEFWRLNSSGAEETQQVLGTESNDSIHEMLRKGWKRRGEHLSRYLERVHGSFDARTMAAVAWENATRSKAAIERADATSAAQYACQAEEAYWIAFITRKLERPYFLGVKNRAASKSGGKARAITQEQKNSKRNEGIRAEVRSLKSKNPKASLGPIAKKHDLSVRHIHRLLNGKPPK
jgi:hypothetical protein